MSPSADLLVTSRAVVTPSAEVVSPPTDLLATSREVLTPEAEVASPSADLLPTSRGVLAPSADEESPSTNLSGASEATVPLSPGVAAAQLAGTGPSCKGIVSLREPRLPCLETKSLPALAPTAANAQRPSGRFA